MGNGDNRRTLKMRQRKSWRRNKLRAQKKIELGKSPDAKKKLGAPSAASAASQSSVAKRKAPTPAKK